jgi:hypothetical protein
VLLLRPAGGFPVLAPQPASEHGGNDDDDGNDDETDGQVDVDELQLDIGLLDGVPDVLEDDMTEPVRPVADTQFLKGISNIDLAVATSVNATGSFTAPVPTEWTYTLPEKRNGPTPTASNANNDDDDNDDIDTDIDGELAPHIIQARDTTVTFVTHAAIDIHWRPPSKRPAVLPALNVCPTLAAVSMHMNLNRKQHDSTFHVVYDVLIHSVCVRRMRVPCVHPQRLRRRH